MQFKHIVTFGIFVLVNILKINMYYLKAKMSELLEEKVWNV